MRILTKKLFFLSLLTITYLHSMKVERANETFQRVTLQPDSRLLLGLPDETLAHIITCMDEYRLYEGIKLFIKLSLVCEKFKHLGVPDTIKTLLHLDQKQLHDYLLTYNMYKDHDYTSCIKLLLAMRTDENKVDLTSLLYNVRNPNLAQLYITHGAQVNGQDKDGKTSLHYAVDCQSPDLVKVLLKNNANMYLQDKFENNPVDYAVIFMESACVKLFIEYGLDTSLKYGSMEETIADWAITCKFPEIYKLITGEEMIKPFEKSSIEVYLQPLLTNKPIHEIALEKINDTCVIS